MLSFIVRRILGAIPTLFALATISFFIMRIAPGSPFSGNRKLSKFVIANIEKRYNLDDPLWLQFVRYLWGVVRFDFGPSMKNQDHTVTELIGQGFPVSIEIGLWAMALATIVGIVLGMAGALRRNGPVDFSVGIVAMVGIAVPTFVIGPILQTVFGLQLHWLPIAGWDGSIQSKIMPILVLTLPNIAYISRLMRGSMIETLRTNYVRTARAKGIGARRVVWRHSLIGALLPVVAYLGPATAITITGSIAIEKIYAIPGIGRYFVDGATNRDYPLVMGVTLLFGAVVILANILTDVLRGLLDPKVSYE
jgi:oligopeptide transport system permease protein